MAWFALARILLVAAVACAAALLRPLPVTMPANVAFALALAALVLRLGSVLQTTAGKMIFGGYIETGMATQSAPPAVEREGEENGQARLRHIQPRQT